MNPYKHRLTQKQKDANNKQWYKDQADLLDGGSLNSNSFLGFGDVSEFKRMKANYDLFNDQINIRDFAYVCRPFGTDVGELPANFANRDIVSSKIKVLLGMEMKMPFSWRVVATNEQATTRKEEEETSKIKEYVIDSVMKPIRFQTEKELRQQQKGQKLTPEEQQQLQQDIDDEVEQKTPDKIRVYMTREHQDPSEALARQLLKYSIPNKRIAHKFNKGFKHLSLSGAEVYWVGMLNGEPDIKPVNSLFFECDKSNDTDFIEDGEWAAYEMRMTPSEVIANFGSDLTEDQIDDIYNSSTNNPASIADADFTFTERFAHEINTLRVKHFTWKALRLVQFLTYKDKSGKEQMMLVDENYKLNGNNGDVRLEREWIPESHECYKIKSDIYVHCRPVPGQDKTLDNLWECKLPYLGAYFDNLNSPVMSPMDRMKGYQYLYNIIIYRIELLMASDEGKILAANINKIPKSSGIDMTKWQYFMKANKIAWFNPNEEGNRAVQQESIGNYATVLDMSLVSDIDKYMKIADYIDRRCGASVGVTPQMEAQIEANEAVTNTRQNLVQSSYIIQPLFELHNTIKENTLDYFLDVSRIAYSQRQPAKLSYVLDDMSMAVLKTDPELLANSSYGLFVANSTKAADAKKAVEQLSQAALQNQQIDFSDIIKVLKSDDINEAAEQLEAGEARKIAQQQSAAKSQQQQDQQKRIADQEMIKEQEDSQARLIVLKETERRKTELQKQAMASMGYDPNKDEDDDGTPDVFEVYKHGVDTDLKTRKLDLEQQNLDHTKEIDNKKLQLEDKKIKMQSRKTTKPSA